MNDVIHLGEEGSAKKWRYFISLFSKMGDKVGGIKNLKKKGWLHLWTTPSYVQSYMNEKYLLPDKSIGSNDGVGELLILEFSNSESDMRLLIVWCVCSWYSDCSSPSFFRLATFSLCFLNLENNENRNIIYFFSSFLRDETDIQLCMYKNRVANKRKENQTYFLIISKWFYDLF